MAFSFLDWLGRCMAIFHPKGHILDGPGMVNEPEWIAFSLSHTGTVAQDIFWFDVTVDDNYDYFVIGSLTDDKGRRLEKEAPIPISSKDMWALKKLKLQHLPNKMPDQNSLDEEYVLDGTTVKIDVTYTDHRSVSKCADTDTAKAVYYILEKYMK